MIIDFGQQVILIDIARGVGLTIRADQVSLGDVMTVEGQFDVALSRMIVDGDGLR